MAKHSAQKAKVLGLIVLVLVLYIVSDKTGLLVRKNVEYTAPKKTDTTMPSVEDQSTTPGSSDKARQMGDDLSIEGGSKAAPTCQEAESADIKAKNIQYEKGSVLVKFETNISFEGATKILAAHDYTYDKYDTEAIDLFPTSHRMTAVVPKGEEIDAVCVLRSEPGVDNAIVNPTFAIHQ